MEERDKGLAILEETILKNLTHEDYARVNKLAKEYFDIFTGENLKDHLEKYVSSRSKPQFEDLCKIYESTIPATVNNLVKLFNKPLRSNRIYSSIDHSNSKGRNEIVERVQNFWQGESESGVDAYLRERWKHLNIYEPNSFVCVEFKAFDNTKEKPYPFPVEYTCEQAIRFKYDNGTLKWFIAKLPIKYYTDTNDKSKTAAGNKYILYLENDAIVLTEVDKNKRIPSKEGAILHEVKDDKGMVHSVYEIEYYRMLSEGVPLFRVGYETDPVTNGRTCLSIIHPALSFFKKEMKTGSEFDLTMSLHVFPQKVQYGMTCTGDKDKGIICSNGKTPNGGICPVCNGASMIQVATSTSDVITVKTPKPGESTTVTPENAFAYKTPPVEFIKFMESYVDRLTQKAKAAVFSPETLEKKVADKTATEMDYSYDNVYDVFHTYGNKYSSSWIFIVRQIAIYTDNYNDNFKIYHKFPNDYKLKSLAVLLNEAKLASESGLSQHAINAINNDVLEAQYADDQDTLLKIKVKDKFHPFSGKSKEEIQVLFMSSDILPYYKTLYTYFDIIFMDIDNTIGDKFYLMTYEKQKETIKEKVDEIQKEVELSAAKEFNVNPIANAEQEGQ